jgi:hypothetical protein
VTCGGAMTEVVYNRWYICGRESRFCCRACDLGRCDCALVRMFERIGALIAFES